jgi:hypothetical protein
MPIRDVDLAFDLVFYNIEAHVFYISLSAKNTRKENDLQSKRITSLWLESGTVSD